MPKKPLSVREWLIKHLTPLMEKGRDLEASSKTLPAKLPTYDRGYWTGLKLILEKYYVAPYLKILVGGRGFRVAYVDLFAGPGLNLIGKKKVPIPGSPLVPVMIQESAHQFSAFIFSDIDHGYVKALRKRTELFDWLPDIVEIHEEDANEMVNKLPRILDRHNIGHTLVFIDPEGMEFKWSSIKKLVDKVNCDLIINFPSVGLHRNLQNPAVARKIRDFLGPGSDPIPPNANESWAIRLYRKNLASIGKDISTEIMVQSGNAFHYHMIPAVRKTVSGSPWFRRIFPPAKQKIESVSGQVLGIIADQIEGTQTSL